MWRILECVCYFRGLFKIFSYSRLVLQCSHWNLNGYIIEWYLMESCSVRNAKAACISTRKRTPPPLFLSRCPLQFLTLYWRTLLENGHSLMQFNPMIGYNALPAINWAFEKGSRWCVLVHFCFESVAEARSFWFEASGLRGRQVGKIEGGILHRQLGHFGCITIFLFILVIVIQIVLH